MSLTLIFFLKLCTQWKGSRVSSTVCEYSWEIHDICTPNHADSTRNAHPCTCDDSACYACTYGCDKHRILCYTWHYPALARYREDEIHVKYAQYTSAARGGSVKWRAIGVKIACIRKFHANVLFHFSTRAYL